MHTVGAPGERFQGLGTADKTYGIGEVPFRWPGIGK